MNGDLTYSQKPDLLEMVVRFVLNLLLCVLADL